MPNRPISFERHAALTSDWKSGMERLALVVLVGLSTAAMAGGAVADVRKIAPERFQPNPRAGTESLSQAEPIIAPTKEHPLGGCDKSARSWIFCLRATADLSDTLVLGAEEAVSKYVLSRPDLNAVTAQGFTRDLKEAGAKWLALRDFECGKMARQEHIEAAKSAYEARMVCQIARDMERADQLVTRYGVAASKETKLDTK
jgi:hypothetical protein